MPRLLRPLPVLLALLILAPAGSAPARDRGADGEFDRRESSHFMLFQDVDIDRSGGWRGSVQFERDVLRVLEQGHDRLDSLLDLRPPRKIDVWVYDPGIFDATFSGLFRFPVAGFYGRAIRVRGDTVVSAQLSRTLHHELVHAAFDAIAPAVILPAWLNEGVAEWFESRTHGKRRLSSGEWSYLARARAQGYWIGPNSLNAPSFGHLRGDGAGLAYLQAYAMVDHLVRNGGEAQLARFLQTLMRMRNVDAALRRVYRFDAAELDARLGAELD